MRGVAALGTLVLLSSPAWAVVGQDGGEGAPQKIQRGQQDLSNAGPGIDDYTGLVWLQLKDDGIEKNDFESLPPDKQRGALRTASASAGKRWQAMADLRKEFEANPDRASESDFQDRLKRAQEWLNQPGFSQGRESEIAHRYLNSLAPIQQNIVAKARPTDDQVQVQQKQADISQKAARQTGAKVKEQSGGWFDMFRGGGSVNTPPPDAPAAPVVDRSRTPVRTADQTRGAIWANQEPPPAPKKKQIQQFGAAKTDDDSSSSWTSFKKSVEGWFTNP